MSPGKIPVDVHDLFWLIQINFHKTDNVRDPSEILRPVGQVRGWVTFDGHHGVQVAAHLGSEKIIFIVECCCKLNNTCYSMSIFILTSKCSVAM